MMKVIMEIDGLFFKNKGKEIEYNSSLSITLEEQSEG